jgi:hypothetical protein
MYVRIVISNPSPTATTARAGPVAGPDVPTIAEAAGDLATAIDRFRQVDRAICRGVLALSRTVGTGISETVEGLPADLLLANLCRLVSSDRSTILTAADVLRHLPVTAGLWADGQLTWGQVRSIARNAARLPVKVRAVLDRRIAASAADHHGLDGYGPDGLLDAVDRATDELRDLAKVLREEQRAERSDFLALQPSLDGGLRLYGELSPRRGAIVGKALQHAAPDPETGVSRRRCGGPGCTHVDELAALAAWSHRLLHRHGWKTRHDPDTGMFTITRDGRTYRSLPKNTPLSPDPGSDPPGDPPEDPPSD